MIYIRKKHQILAKGFSWKTKLALHTFLISKL